jgi:hypothetical protein
MEEDSPLERVLRLALVQLARRLPSLGGALDSVEGEQGPLNPPDLAQGQGEDQ